jgi:hypothetical protein
VLVRAKRLIEGDRTHRTHSANPSRRRPPDTPKLNFNQWNSVFGQNGSARPRAGRPKGCSSPATRAIKSAFEEKVARRGRSQPWDPREGRLRIAQQDFDVQSAVDWHFRVFAIGQGSRADGLQIPWELNERAFTSNGAQPRRPSNAAASRTAAPWASLYHDRVTRNGNRCVRPQGLVGSRTAR